MAQTQEYIGTLVVINCASCGMTFGMTETFKQRRLNDHEGFYCPAGHNNYYSGKSEAEKLRETLAQKESRILSLSSVVDQQRETIQSKDYVIRATRAAKTKLKKRISAGACPCCNRTFQNLANHMKCQHPEFNPA